MSRAHLRRRPESPVRFGASSVASRWTGWGVGLPDDAMGSLWATSGAFRVLTLAYSLFIHSMAISHYSRPHLASALIAVQCIWSGIAAYAMFARRTWRPVLVGLDQVVTLALVYSTWIVAPESWWDHNQSLPTTMWVTNAVLTAGMMWGVGAGFASAVVLGLACLHVGGDLSWLERSPTLPILVSAGIAAGVASHGVQRAHEQLTRALELRARAAERERLARQVHDGVLQVLALTAREGERAGGEFARVGQLAAEQEQALRHLIADGDDSARRDGTWAGNAGAVRLNGLAGGVASSLRDAGQNGVALGGGALDAGIEASSVDAPARGAARRSDAPDPTDLRQALLALESRRCHVSAGAEAVTLRPDVVAEITAAVRQALTNTDLHAGRGGAPATSYVLLEDLGDEVVVTVRDDGVGMSPERPAQARAEGRLGVSGSIVGRIEAIGGRAHLTTVPGEGVEWEFTVPR